MSIVNQREVIMPWDGVDFYYSQFVTGYTRRGIRNDGKEVSDDDLGREGSFTLHYKEEEYDGTNKEEVQKMLAKMEEDGYLHIAWAKGVCGVS